MPRHLKSLILNCLKDQKILRMLESFGFVYETNIILHIISKLKLKQTSYFFHYPIDLSSTRGGSTDPFQTPSVVTVVIICRGRRYDPYKTETSNFRKREILEA